jgi:hypothetical protein
VSGVYHVLISGAGRHPLMGVKKGPHSRAAPAWSVFGCKHDGEQADGLPRIARVSGSVFETGVEKLKMAAA